MDYQIEKNDNGEHVITGNGEVIGPFENYSAAEQALTDLMEGFWGPKMVQTINAIQMTPATSPEHQKQKDTMLSVARDILDGKILFPIAAIFNNEWVAKANHYPAGTCPVAMTAINAACLIKGGCSIDKTMRLLGLNDK